MSLHIVDQLFSTGNFAHTLVTKICWCTYVLSTLVVY